MEATNKLSYKIAIEIDAAFCNYDVRLKFTDISFYGMKHLFRSPKEMIKEMLGRVKGYSSLTVTISACRLDEQCHYVDSINEVRFVHEYVNTTTLERMKISTVDKGRFDNWNECTFRTLYSNAESMIEYANGLQLNDK